MRKALLWRFRATFRDFMEDSLCAISFLIVLINLFKSYIFNWCKLNDVCDPDLQHEHR